MSSASRRQPDLYWKQLQQLKAASICIRLYRNSMHRRVQMVDGVKAIASSGAIAGWVVWKDYPFLWSSIIVAAQLLDALKGVFPFAKLHKAASDLTIALETIWIDAEDEWESIFMGKIPEDLINKRRTRLRKLQLEAEKKHFPEGFAPSEKLLKLATEEANNHFQLTYAEEETDVTTATDAFSPVPEARIARQEYLPELHGERADADWDRETPDRADTATGSNACKKVNGDG